MTMLTRDGVKHCLFTLLLSGLMLSGCTTSEESLTAASKMEQASTPSTAQLPTVRLGRQPIVSIDSLQVDQVGEMVMIAGSVSQRSPLLEGWLYQVQDESGSLWVVTRTSEPEVGQPAIVEGTVQYEAIVVEGIDSSEIYLEEQTYLPSEG